MYVKWQILILLNSVTQMCKTVTWTSKNLSLLNYGQRELFKMWTPFPVRKKYPKDN